MKRKPNAFMVRSTWWIQHLEEDRLLFVIEFLYGFLFSFSNQPHTAPRSTIPVCLVVHEKQMRNIDTTQTKNLI